MNNVLIVAGGTHSAGGAETLSTERCELNPDGLFECGDISPILSRSYTYGSAFAVNADYCT